MDPTASEVRIKYCKSFPFRFETVENSKYASKTRLKYKFSSPNRKRHNRVLAPGRHF